MDRERRPSDSAAFESALVFSPSGNFFDDFSASSSNMFVQRRTGIRRESGVLGSVTHNEIKLHDLDLNINNQYQVENSTLVKNNAENASLDQFHGDNKVKQEDEEEANNEDRRPWESTSTSTTKSGTGIGTGMGVVGAASATTNNITNAYTGGQGKKRAGGVNASMRNLGAILGGSAVKHGKTKPPRHHQLDNESGDAATIPASKPADPNSVNSSKAKMGFFRKRASLPITFAQVLSENNEGELNKKRMSDTALPMTPTSSPTLNNNTQTTAQNNRRSSRKLAAFFKRDDDAS